MQVGQLLSASFHASWVGLAVGVHLAAPRLGRRSAGLALVGPVLLGDAVGYLGLLAFDRDLLPFLAVALALSLVGGTLAVPPCVALGDRALRARGLLDEEAMG